MKYIKTFESLFNKASYEEITSVIDNSKPEKLNQRDLSVISKFIEILKKTKNDVEVKEYTMMVSILMIFIDKESAINITIEKFDDDYYLCSIADMYWDGKSYQYHEYTDFNHEVITYKCDSIDGLSSFLENEVFKFMLPPLRSSFR